MEKRQKMVTANVWRKKTTALYMRFLWRPSLLNFNITFVILLRRVVSMGLFLEMGTVFHPSSWGGFVLPPPGVCGPLPPMFPPILPPPPPPPESFLDISCCWTLICSRCSSNSASLWIWSIVLGPWSPLRGTQLFCESQVENSYITVLVWRIIIYIQDSHSTHEPCGLLQTQH